MFTIYCHRLITVFIAIVKYTDIEKHTDYEEKKITNLYDNWLYNILLDNLKNECILFRIDKHTISVLIPNGRDNYNNFLSTINKINTKSIEFFDQKLNIAISDENKGIDGVYIAYNHAYYMLGIDNQLLVKEYRLHQELRTEDEDVLSRKAIQNFYKYIISGDINTLKNEMYDISSILSNTSSREIVYQTYYTIRFVLEDVMEDLNVKQPIPNYDSKTSIQEMIEQLNCAVLAKDIAEKIQILKIEMNYHILMKIIKLIICTRNNFEEFNCSEKYVYKW